MVSWLERWWVARTIIYPNSPVVPLLGSLPAHCALLPILSLLSLALSHAFITLLPPLFSPLLSFPLSSLISLSFSVVLQLALVIGGPFRHPSSRRMTLGVGEACCARPSSS